MPAFMERISDLYRRKYSENPLTTLFTAASLVALAVFLIIGGITLGDSILNVFFYRTADAFMDFFNSINYSSDGPYTKYGVIYPPLATLMYYIIGLFTIPFVGETTTLAAALKGSFVGMLSFIIVTALMLYLLYWAVMRITRNTEISGKILFLLILISFPCLYAIERGNCILVLPALILIFLMGYRSENKTLRYISYAALGCAVGLKIYTVLMGLLVLREKKYKEIAVCAFIGLMTFMIPFIFTDGDPISFLNRMFEYAGSVRGVYGIVNLNDLVLTLFGGVFSDSQVDSLGVILTIMMMVISAVIAVFCKEMKFWKIVTLISCNLILGFGVGTPYLYIYLAVPLVLFLMEEKETTRENMFFLICFTAVMILIPGPGFERILIWITNFKTIFVILITAALMSEGIAGLYRSCRNRMSKVCPCE